MLKQNAHNKTTQFILCLSNCAEVWLMYPPTLHGRKTVSHFPLDIKTFFFLICQLYSEMILMMNQVVNTLQYKTRQSLIITLRYIMTSCLSICEKHTLQWQKVQRECATLLQKWMKEQTQSLIDQTMPVLSLVSSSPTNCSSSLGGHNYTIFQLSRSFSPV